MHSAFEFHAMALQQSEIVEFYKDQTLFITGGTGFLGKVLIEKLLRVCSVKKIYILTRPKKGKTTHERFDSFFDFPCFDRLKSERDDFKNKISLIEGECAKLNLGLSLEDRGVLKKEVTCFIHAAANVKFDQTLRSAASNARSVRDALELAKQMPKLKSFVFVSTAYSNCIYPYIGEKFYDSPMTADELFALLRESSEELLEKATSRILGSYPNTYVFTKCIAENIVKEESGDLPVSIVRPAAVMSTADEPMPGWIDNFYGPIGIATVAALGVLRSLHASPDAIANLVPCDFVANCVLASAWRVAISKHNNDTIPIFNYIGYKRNPVTWRDYQNVLEKHRIESASVKSVWYYSFKMRENYYWHTVCVFFQHTVTAYIADFLLIISGRAPLAVRNYARLNDMMRHMAPFSTKSWCFGVKNVDDLWKSMGEVDKKLFNFDMDAVCFSKYIDQAALNGRVYLLKDPLETLPQGRRKMRNFRILHYSLLTLLAVLLICFGMCVLLKSKK